MNRDSIAPVFNMCGVLFVVIIATRAAYYTKDFRQNLRKYALQLLF